MIGREVVHLESVPSTMDVIDGYARDGAQEGLVVVADYQSAGRGRLKRTWSSESGDSLLCSILLRPPVVPARLGLLPLLLGAAVAETLDSFITEICQVKWPNDVLIGCRKVAGILVQSRIGTEVVDFVNVGIGINITGAPEALKEGATSLAEHGRSGVTRDEVLGALLPTLNREYEKWVESSDHPSLTRWRHRAVLIGERVSVRQEGESIRGIFRDVDEDGRMLLELTSGERLALASGDLELGPRGSVE
jgi:BirA family biotin operon repressor/biotin-[acetyl-CoA-carboxylase] ligase